MCGCGGICDNCTRPRSQRFGLRPDPEKPKNVDITINVNDLNPMVAQALARRVLAEIGGKDMSVSYYEHEE